MAYVDTNVIIAYGFEDDPNHDKATSLVERYRGAGEFYGSPLTLVELYSSLHRNIQRYRLPQTIMQLSDERIKVKSIVQLLLRSLDIKIFPEDCTVESVDNFKIHRIFNEAVQLVHRIRLRTLDLLHVVYAKLLAERGLVRYFITLDSDIIKRRREIHEVAGLNIVDS
ncbi:MAG: type II toxin-antitoxin system VapC family toxin [Sulfolobales archaeon]